MTEPTLPKLAKALVEAQSDVRALEKDGDNKHHGYSYTSAEALIDEARRVLNKRGLAFDEVAAVVSLDTTPPTAHTRYVLSHESGEARGGYESAWPVIEGKGRPLDKVFAGACTSALAYKLRGLLLIPRSDDIADMDRRDDRAHDPPKREGPAPEPRREEPRPEGTVSDARSLFGDKFADVLDLVRARALARDVIEDQIKRTDLSPGKSAAISLLVDAYYATDAKDIPPMASKIRGVEMPAQARDWLLEEIKIPWRALRPAESKAVAS